MPFVEPQADLGGHGMVQAEIDREQRFVGGGIGLHREWHGHRYDEVVLVVVDENLVPEETALASLHDDHDARLVEHGGAAQWSVGTQKTHVRQRGQRVALVRSQVTEQGDHAVA